MNIIKEGKLKAPENSLNFFREHYDELGELKYIVLYYAEKEWSINPEVYHQYTILMNEKAQIWMSGFTWGYYGAGPRGLLELLQMIDPEITCEEVANLEWMAKDPIVFENVKGKLVLRSFNESICSLLSIENDRLPWKAISKDSIKDYQEILENIRKKIGEKETPYSKDYIKIQCYICGNIYEIRKNGCYCDQCKRYFSESEIRKNCGI